MKIDVTQKLLDLDGKEMRIVVQGCQFCGRPMEDSGVRTLRNTLTDALGAPYQDEQNLEGSKKLERHLLAVRIHSEDELELTVKEVALLMELTGKRYATALMGPVWMMLESG